MHNLLQTTQKDNTAVAIAVGITIINRKERECADDVDNLVNRVNNVHIIDVNLTLDVVSRMLLHRRNVFTVSETMGLSLLNCSMTPLMVEACNDCEELIQDSLAVIRTII